MKDKKKVILLDRDGVINKKMPPHEYVLSWGEFEFLPGAIEGIKLLKDAGFTLVLITNQQGIGKELMTNNNLVHIHNKMLSILSKNGTKIDYIYHCPHLQDENCNCRKPKSGMVEKAAKEIGFNPRETILIGDGENDKILAKNVDAKFFKVDKKNNLLAVAKRIILKKP
jgi:D-glycero-D-manno-heptose 1,7-bisphosphate phosphatase